MTTTATVSSIRDSARAIIEAIARSGDDYPVLAAALKQAIAGLVERDDLVDLGAPRQGNNVASSYYLYFDGQLSILLFEVPTDKIIPPHDHGIWEAIGTYRGRVSHRVMQRTDDRSVTGHATLETVSDQVLEPGDLVIIAPPADIHSFTALQPGTWGLTIASSAYRHERHYFQPEKNTYAVMPPVNRR
jgi:predicted metal-dependent enzyme (double-stranded beta helix superfamily)